MASPTKISKVRKAINKARRAKLRKAFERNHGTTRPDLPLNVPTANEIAQKKNAGKK